MLSASQVLGIIMHLYCAQRCVPPAPIVFTIYNVNKLLINNAFHEIFFFKATAVMYFKTLPAGHGGGMWRCLPCEQRRFLQGWAFEAVNPSC